MVAKPAPNLGLGVCLTVTRASRLNVQQSFISPLEAEAPSLLYPQQYSHRALPWSTRKVSVTFRYGLMLRAHGRTVAGQNRDIVDGHWIPRRLRVEHTLLTAAAIPKAPGNPWMRA
ncbi:hypothetical protein FA95DRAFT_585414 [Auriscalpium vulgare]|uniref:Uncharacterized protein n=1 Tax=Auriscalpium vulgare TaxID=40419 RepID=A0ACB8REN7_9AGAM|nr:hypothetical protein FA95DRAFT_585414 [Auriscalpium vulgare]